MRRLTIRELRNCHKTEGGITDNIVISKRFFYQTVNVGTLDITPCANEYLLTDMTSKMILLKFAS